MQRLIGQRTITDLKTRILPAGLRDVQEWTGVTITFRRRGSSGWSDIVTMPAISIRLNDGRGMEAVGGVETTNTGTLKVWANELGLEAIQQGDRFNWNGHVCIVNLVHPVKLDLYITVEFTLLEE